MPAIGVRIARDDLDRLQRPEDPTVVLQQLLKTLAGQRLRRIVHDEPPDAQRPSRLDPRAAAIELLCVEAERVELGEGDEAAQRASPAGVDREVGQVRNDGRDALEQVRSCAISAVEL